MVCYIGNDFSSLIRVCVKKKKNLPPPFSLPHSPSNLSVLAQAASARGYKQSGAAELGLLGPGGRWVDSGMGPGLATPRGHSPQDRSGRAAL